MEININIYFLLNIYTINIFTKTPLYYNDCHINNLQSKIKVIPLQIDEVLLDETILKCLKISMVDPYKHVKQYLKIARSKSPKTNF